MESLGLVVELKSEIDSDLTASDERPFLFLAEDEMIVSLYFYDSYSKAHRQYLQQNNYSFEIHSQSIL
jgi:hypothetical protein